MLRLTRIPQTVRNVKRFQKILQVIAKHGFSDVLASLGLDSLLHQVKVTLRRPPAPERRTEVRIRLAIEELGATFVKLGQVLATRPDLVPMSVIKELRKLQDDVPAVPPEQILALLEEELGQSPRQVFEEFSEAPLAAASIGQVHRAKLLSGEEVVLKVQRPGLDQQIATDLDIMRWIAKLVVENIPESKRYDPLGLVSQFERSILKETDFMREAMHMKRFARNFADDETVYVPKVFDAYTTRRVLCEEFVVGLKCDAAAITEQPLEARSVIARRGINCILTQTFVHGFFHADPHPGNIFILEDQRVCFIDYGMMGILEEERIDELLAFLIAILSRDAESMVRLFARLDLIDESVDERALRLDLIDLLERYGSLEIAKIDIGQIIGDVFDVLVRHEIRVPSDLLLVGKALATIDGVAREIYPELDPIEALRPKLLEIYLKHLSTPKRLARRPKRLLESLLDLAESLPKDLRLTLRKLRQGELRVNANVSDLKHILNVHSRSQNRLFLGMIVAALAIATSILLQGNETPIGSLSLSLQGLLSLSVGTLVGLIFLALSILYGVVLFVGFLRSGGV